MARRPGRRVDGPGPAAWLFDEAGAGSLDEIKAYLDCRSRGVEPPRPLAEAWEGFYGFYAPRLHTFLRRWSLSEADRSDCAQEVWHEVVAQLARFGHDPGRARLSTWMMALARNKAVDAIRQRHRHVFESLGDAATTAALDPSPDPAAAYERGRARAQVQRALAQLSAAVSPTSFRVLYLRWIEGRPTAEVAAALALTPGQVRFRTHRMKRKIRDLLEQSMARDALGIGPDGTGEDRAADGRIGRKTLPSPLRPGGRPRARDARASPAQHRHPGGE